MATEEWKRTQITESGNYPKQSFKGVLKAIYPTVTESGIPVLQLDFEDGKTYNMPTSAKDGQYGVHEDGTVDGFMAIGQFIASIEQIDPKTGLHIEGEAVNGRIETFWTFLDGTPAGFKTEPDIVGKILHNVARPRQVPAKEGKPEYPDWTIGAIEGLTAQPVKKKGGYPEVRKPKPTKEQPPIQASSGLADALLEAGVVGENISDVFAVTFGKKYRVPELRAALATIGLEVAQNGIIQKRVV